MIQGIFIGYALNSGGGWTRDLIIADWHDIENGVASGVHVKRFKSKEVRTNKLQEVSILPCADGRFPETRKSHTTSNLTPPESRELRRGGAPSTLGEASRDPLPCARRDFLEEGGDADISEADRDAVETRCHFWSMTGAFMYRQ